MKIKVPKFGRRVEKTRSRNFLFRFYRFLKSKDVSWFLQPDLEPAHTARY